MIAHAACWFAWASLSALNSSSLSCSGTQLLQHRFILGLKLMLVEIAPQQCKEAPINAAYLGFCAHIRVG